MVFLLFTDFVDAAGRGKPARRRKTKPQNCIFKEKKHKNGNPCKPFWNIKKPVCQTRRSTLSRFCNKKFCWKMVNDEARKENELVPKGKKNLLE